ncbi:hypothetical protein OROMI_025472 [Orobanche minor]
MAASYPNAFSPSNGAANSRLTSSISVADADEPPKNSFGIDKQISAVRHSHRLAKAISQWTSSHTVPKLHLQCNSFTNSSRKAQESVHTELIEVDKDGVRSLSLSEQQLYIESCKLFEVLFIP